MAQPQLLQVKLSRFDAQPWGFRLQGGVDFAAPLLVQKVNGGSLAEKAGLIPGDAVIKINDVDVFNLRHKDAQDIVVRSGNNFVMTIQRGGSTWRPHVTPTGQLPQHNQSPYLQTVTKTSLAHKQQDSQHIGCGYNNSARPFANGGDGSVKSIVNKQYNTPVGIYSDESIAETLSAQAEVLAGGVLGVNFKKNEKEYQAEKSEVLKFLREEESGKSTPAFNSHTQHQETQQHQHQHQHPPQQQQQQQQHHYQQQQQHHQQSTATRHVTAPINTPKPPSTGGLPTGQNICTECERLITGVFVRIKDKNLHVECFKCATCGTSLKNQGYYNFNNKLYCEIHAKLAAQQNPPSGTDGYVPVPIKPHTPLSAGTISAALSAHGYNNGVANGGPSTPTPPSDEDSTADLPLPPPPSPTQLQKYENELQNKQLQKQHIPTEHLPSMPTDTITVKATQSSVIDNQTSTGHVNALPLEYFVSPLEQSHQSSSSTFSSSPRACDVLSGSYVNSIPVTKSVSAAVAMPSTALPPPPPPPPIPALSYNQNANAKCNSTAPNASTLCFNNKRYNNGVNSMLQQQQHLQHATLNENDLNIQNKNSWPTANTNTTNTQTHNAYNKLLKEYSNKLTQSSNSSHNNKSIQTQKLIHNESNSHANTNTSSSTPKPCENTDNNSNKTNIKFSSSPNDAKNMTSPGKSHVAATAATIANQLKFNLNQVPSSLIVAPAPLQLPNQTTFDENKESCNKNLYNDCEMSFSASSMATTVMPNESIYGQINTGSFAPTDEQRCSSNIIQSDQCDNNNKPFEYVTLTGNVIRSVVPPGKGANINYRVNQGYARPFGASPAPPAAAPKSPISYPPPSSNPYATLPRTNVGQQELCTNNSIATLPFKTQANEPLAVAEIDLNQTKSLATDLQNDEATQMLAESIGKINMGKKMNNFMTEASKIISNMLEARLANGGGGGLMSNSGSTLSLGSNSSSNPSRSPMVMRKRFELDDFKDVDPTEPKSLKPVVVVQQQQQPLPQGPNTSGQKAQPQIPTQQPARDMQANHPINKIIGLCDSTADNLRSSSPIGETVVHRSDENVQRRSQRDGERSTHAFDRRSYIEQPPPMMKNTREETLDGPVFSINVKAMGPNRQANDPLSAENEQVVSQLLKDGKRPICCQCDKEIKVGPFITALGRIWCPDHFICVNANCRRPLQDIGFVEEKGDLYCEYCFEKYLAPTCSKCASKIKGDCLNAIGKHFHPECFTCGHCGKMFGNTPFFLEDGNAYCEADWNELFTTKCFACGFPVEAGDRWVEALNHNYHSQCFNCTFCKQNLEGQSFYNKGGRPFCKNHAR